MSGEPAEVTNPVLFPKQFGSIDNNIVRAWDQAFQQSSARVAQAQEVYQVQAASIPMNDPRFSGLRVALDSTRTEHNKTALPYYEIKLEVLRTELGDKLIRPDDTIRVLDRMGANQQITNIDPDADIFLDIQGRLQRGERIETIRKQAVIGVEGRAQIIARYEELSQRQTPLTPQEQQELNGLKGRAAQYKNQAQAREYIARICDLRQIVRDATARQAGVIQRTDAQALSQTRQEIQGAQTSLPVDIEATKSTLGSEVADLSSAQLNLVVYWAFHLPNQETTFAYISGMQDKRPSLFSILQKALIEQGKLPNPQDPDPKKAREAEEFYEKTKAWIDEGGD